MIDMKGCIMKKRHLLAISISILMILGCAERTPEYPWIYDLDAEVDAQGKMVGYEFWAKW